MHVFGHSDLLLVVGELHLGGVGREVYATDNVSPLVTPVGDDRRSNDMLLDELLELAIGVCLALELIDLIQTGNGRHESEQRVNGDNHTRL